MPLVSKPPSNLQKFFSIHDWLFWCLLVETWVWVLNKTFQNIQGHATKIRFDFYQKQNFSLKKIHNKNAQKQAKNESLSWSKNGYFFKFHFWYWIQLLRFPTFSGSPTAIIMNSEENVHDQFWYTKIKSTLIYWTLECIFCWLDNKRKKP